MKTLTTMFAAGYRWTFAPLVVLALTSGLFARGAESEKSNLIQKAVSVSFLGGDDNSLITASWEGVVQLWPVRPGNDALANMPPE